MKTSKHTEAPTTKSIDGAACRIDIQIESKGDVKIYNCTAAAPEQPCPPLPCDEYPPLPTPEGACVPLALGAKPKQSRKCKIQNLLASKPVPSSLAASLPRRIDVPERGNCAPFTCHPQNASTLIAVVDRPSGY
jgi:hypothetical protein